MSQSIETSRTPTFNHIAMSVPAELLGEQGRGDLLRFFGEVFGWTEMPGMTEDKVRLVLRAYSNEQFVYVHASEQPQKLDHASKQLRHFLALVSRSSVVICPVSGWPASFCLCLVNRPSTNYVHLPQQFPKRV